MVLERIKKPDAFTLGPKRSQSGFQTFWQQDTPGHPGLLAYAPLCLLKNLLFCVLWRVGACSLSEASRQIASETHIKPESIERSIRREQESVGRTLSELSRLVRPRSARVGTFSGGNTTVPPENLSPPTVTVPFALSVSFSICPILRKVRPRSARVGGVWSLYVTALLNPPVRRRYGTEQR